MRTTWWLLLVLILVTGCARSTIETRKRERYGSYSSLPEEQRQMVNSGQVKVGMSKDAVYIAWGKPDQVFSSESNQGSTVSWLYHDTHLESYRYWSYRTVRYRHHYRSEPYFAHDYQVRAYVSAEVIFENGAVKEWRTLPYPVY